MTRPARVPRPIGANVAPPLLGASLAAGSIAIPCSALTSGDAVDADADGRGADGAGIIGEATTRDTEGLGDGARGGGDAVHADSAQRVMAATARGRRTPPRLV